MTTRSNPALDPLADKLRQVHTIPALVQYLHDELGWPVNVDDWEDNLFDWQPDELNLKAEHEVRPMDAIPEFIADPFGLD